MKVLFYGAGVIGSLYAAKIAKCKYDVTVLARGNRLSELKSQGLVIQDVKKNKCESVDIRTIESLESNDIYDYIFITMRNDQVNEILPILKMNKSPNIVFMVNNPLGPEQWINELGKERILLAFPGAGGKRENGVIYYHIISQLIQPTTVGEMDGSHSDRLNKVVNIFKSAGFPVKVSSNMDCWQKSHIAMISPMSNAIYYTQGDNYSVSKNKDAIRIMNLSIKEGLTFLKLAGYKITPSRMNLFLISPLWILNIIMKTTFNTKWAETVISNHSLIARAEMKVVAKEFINLAKEAGYEMKNYSKLASYI